MPTLMPLRLPMSADTAFCMIFIFDCVLLYVES